MPEFLDILNEALESNCHRIADLCNLRDQVTASFEERFSKCRALEEMLQVELQLHAARDTIDAEIELLSRGTRKLIHQIEVTS